MAKRSASSPVSLETIAERAGVSVMTVSRALDGKHKGKRADAERRVARILKIAHQLGYRRNMAARTLVTRRSNCIGILRSIDETRNHLPVSRLRGIEAALAEHRMALSLAQFSDEKLLNNAHVPSILQEWTVDGLLVDYMRAYPGRLDELLRHYQVPAIWVNSRHEWDCVYFDDFGAAQLATERLLRLGHRRIAIWMPHPQRDVPHYSSLDRQAGYETAMRVAGLEPRSLTAPLFGRNYHDHAQRVPTAQGWLRAEDRPTAVLTTWLADAVAMQTAALSLGLKIPEDVSMVTFADELYLTGAMRMSTMLLPEYDMGVRAVKLMMQKIRSPGESIPPVALSATLEEGYSMAPPPARPRVPNT